ncbi:MAG TPA: alpha/beta hydrolase [Dehalococcoidia bacterium]|nr:alpha/beta hydrolase [Dehalococcoidia bacterium]
MRSQKFRRPVPKGPRRALGGDDLPAAGGRGPFPGILFVHGGAWNAGNRTQQEIFNTGLASSGLVIASVDFRLAPDHPYPAQVQDTRCGIRSRRPTPRSLTPRRTLSVGRELRAATIP